MRQKDFLFNILLLLFLNLLIKPFWTLGIDVKVQNVVGSANYGLFFAVFNFTYLFNMLLDVGITNFNNRNIARHTQLLSKHISGILALKLLLGVFYLIVVFCIGFFIGYDSLQLKILIWTAVNQFLNALILYLRSNISALLFFKTDSFLSVLDKLLMVVICSVLLWGNVTNEPFQIMWFVYSQTISYFLAASVALLIVINKAKIVKLTWNYTFFRAILKKSFPFALLFLLMAFYNRIDAVMIERILPFDIAAYQTGIYASAFRLLDALVMIAYLFSVILLPLFSKMLKHKENLVPIVKSSFTLLYFFSVTSSILLVAYHLPILKFFYPTIANESASVFIFLIPCIIPISMTYIFGTLLTANGNMRLLNVTALVGIFVNVIINAILIPILGAKGAAIASLSTQSTVALIQMFIAFKQLKISISVIPIFRCFLYTVLLLGAIYLASVYLHQEMFISLILCSFFAVLLAFATRLIPLSFIKNILTKKE